jgi:sugar lactone lactonase YvrE
VKRLSRFSLRPDGSLGPKEVVTEFGHGTFPDGLAFDAAGQVWIASIVSNRLLRVDPASGKAITVLEDADEAHVEWFEDAYRVNALDRPHMDRIASKKLGNVSSLAFAGPNLDQILVGCLLDSHIYRLPSPVAGFAPVHWMY